MSASDGVCFLYNAAWPMLLSMPATNTSCHSSCSNRGSAVYPGGKQVPMFGTAAPSNQRLTGLVGSGGSSSGAAPPPAFVRPRYPPAPVAVSGAGGGTRSSVRVQMTGDVVLPLVVEGPWQAGPGETCASVFPSMEVRAQALLGPGVTACTQVTLYCIHPCLCSGADLLSCSI
jgi:hypothetical protein